jgi:hypothetical protein
VIEGGIGKGQGTAIALEETGVGKLGGRFPRPRDHAGGQVEARHRPREWGKCHRDAADAAAEVEHLSVNRRPAPDHADQLVGRGGERGRVAERIERDPCLRCLDRQPVEQRGGVGDAGPLKPARGQPGQRGQAIGVCARQLGNRFGQGRGIGYLARQEQLRQRDLA